MSRETIHGYPDIFVHKNSLNNMFLLFSENGVDKLLHRRPSISAIFLFRYSGMPQFLQKGALIMENEILTKIYGEFCSLRGEMTEFKKRTLERLEEVEGNFKQSSVERAARLCRTVSLITGLISIISASYTVLSKFIEKGAVV